MVFCGGTNTLFGLGLLRGMVVVVGLVTVLFYYFTTCSTNSAIYFLSLDFFVCS